MNFSLLISSLFQVRWDEISTVHRPDKVSPWNIEPAATSAPQPIPTPRLKRPRANMAPSTESSVLTKEGMVHYHYH